MNMQASFTLRGRNPDVLTCIANLSNDEVFFGAATFKEGCKRIVNQHKDFASSRLRVNQSRS